jgi:hypothetical protein
MADEEGSLLGRQAIAQVMELIRRFAADLVNPDAGHRGAPPALLTEVKYLAKATTTISGRSGTTPGSGTVQVLWVTEDESDPPNLTLENAQANGEDWTEEVLNWVTSTIANGTYVTIFEDPWGRKWIDAEEC